MKFDASMMIHSERLRSLLQNNDAMLIKEVTRLIEASCKEAFTAGRIRGLEDAKRIINRKGTK